MKDRKKDIVVTFLFIIIIFGVFILNLFIKDKEISTSERRKLKQFPNISKYLFNGELNDEFENYAMDQFLCRDNIRSIKTFIKLDVLRQKENNDLFVSNNKIHKLLYPLDEKSVLNISSKMNNIYNNYLEDCNVYFTIVPDKNYFLEENTLKINYDDLKSMMLDNVNNNIKYIDIFDRLSIDDYYDTDTHWKQEELLNTMNKISEDMGFKDRIENDFKVEEYGEFYGAYYGQLGKKMKPDNIKYLTNEILENATTFNYETQKEAKIYDKEKADSSMDKYDLFLSGATPIIQIRNKMAKTNKELIVFRDSFGSSIVPLFTEAYEKITLVDTRYISTELLEQYVDFKFKDVLFLYSTLIINESGALK